MAKFKVGDVVLYHGTWGSEAPRKCVITDAGDTKNGRPVYGNDLGHWGYENQYGAAEPGPEDEGPPEPDEEVAYETMVSNSAAGQEARAEMERDDERLGGNPYDPDSPNYHQN